MIIRIDELIEAIGASLDILESEVTGAGTNHGKRVATLCACMGTHLGMNDNTLLALTSCALLHDNAITEYILSEREGEGQARNIKLHCEIGQKNIETLPFKASTEGFILYHHERADGKGPFGKREGEFPLGAELIAIADMIDVEYHLQHFPVKKLPSLQDEIKSRAGKAFTRRAADALLAVLNEEMLISLGDDKIRETTKQKMPDYIADIEDASVLNLAELVSRIIDYKSVFTKKHSVQIANRAWLMGGYYNFDRATKIQVYLAAALHDLGKINVPNDILEKPGRLDENEFNIIKEHARSTYDLLKEIDGFENICGWAANHHEKLDGSGYPFGKKASELDFISRMITCIDIYQAVSEERPYHPKRRHEETMPILYDMADKGLIDGNIVKDIDAAMAGYSLLDVPAPVMV